MLNIKSISLSCKHGTEGPKYDPYSYTERTVEINGTRVTLHGGLAVWLKIDKSKVEFPDSWGNNYGEPERTMFEQLTGMTVDEFDRYYDRINPPWEDFPEMYPGERWG